MKYMAFIAGMEYERGVTECYTSNKAIDGP